MRLSFWTLQYLRYQNITWSEVLTVQDFQRVPRFLTRRLDYIDTTAHKYLPESLDWRDEGVVGPVHDQQDCNSCWAFAAAGSMEYWLKKELPDAEINVQDVLACSPHTYGCMGGLMDDAFQYDGLFSLGYDYDGEYAGKCKPRTKGVRATGMQVMTFHPEQQLAYMLHNWGPVTVAIDFTKQIHYKGGVIKQKECGDDPHHAVLVVGYTPVYWIVKNSKGTGWGHDGYAYVERHKKACGINTYASVSTGIEIIT